MTYVYVCLALFAYLLVGAIVGHFSYVQYRDEGLSYSTCEEGRVINGLIWPVYLPVSMAAAFFRWVGRRIERLL